MLLDLFFAPDSFVKSKNTFNLFVSTKLIDFIKYCNKLR